MSALTNESALCSFGGKKSSISEREHIYKLVMRWQYKESLLFNIFPYVQADLKKNQVHRKVAG